MINLLKSDIGEISKNIFDRINKYIFHQRNGNGKNADL